MAGLEIWNVPPWPAEALSDSWVSFLSASLRQQVLASGPFDGLIVGKPSRLAVLLIHALRQQNPRLRVLWDLMDDMPAFHLGLAARRMEQQTQALWPLVHEVWASSTALLQLAREALLRCGSEVEPRFVPNGIESERYLALGAQPIRGSEAEPRVRRGLTLGYVGSIASWMDWSSLIALAKARPEDTLRLIGPVHASVPNLPPNMRLEPAVAHTRIPDTLRSFDWGLIPFLENRLTRSVDPIKYYEYRASGLPVLSTSFGEMRLRREPDGVWPWTDAIADPGLLDAIALRGGPVSEEWIRDQDWSVRFGAHWPDILK